MKKSLLALSVTALFFASCKKDTTPAAFTPTDMTGAAHIKGNVTKNVVTPNGGGGWTANTRVPAANVNISVRIAKSSLYPNSNAQGSDVYTGKSDANGNYDIQVTANGSGVVANIVIDGFSATLDTVINGVTKTGLPCLYVGTSANVNAWTGQNSWFNYNFNATNIGTNPNNIVIGTAMVTGSVGMNFVRQAITVQTSTIGPPNGTVTTTTIVPVSNQRVYLDFTMDPTALALKSYSTTTDAAGNYTFNLSTVAAGTPGFNQNASIWVPDMHTTRDTVKVTTTMNGTMTVSSSTAAPVTGMPGVYNMVNTSQNGVYNTEIRNAVNMTYNAFQPD
jgi:hypothetical protein